MEEKTKSNGFKNFIRNFKKPTWLLSLAMVLVLVGSVFAQMFNTSLYNVKVTDITLETDSYDGELSGLLYMPSTCDEENKCPLIITTHGYLNSKEMQDAPAVELSRRGYIVLALDMYDHGSSTWDAPATFTFWQTALWDAAKVMYEKDYVLKDADGNGMIAVSGHSMGGFSSHLAVYFDEENYQEMLGSSDPDVAAAAHRKIAINLAVGADFKRMEMPDSRTPEDMRVIKSHEEVLAMYAGRTSGTIAAHYDEFFFLDRGNAIKPGDTSKGYEFPANTVVYKDWVKTDTGKYYLGNGSNLETDEEYTAGTFYDVYLDNTGSYTDEASSAYHGQRVVYTPSGTHPWNHFSTEVTGNMVEFYNTAFEYQLGEAGLATAFEPTEKGGQIWWLKEAFEFVAMIGLFLAIIPAITLLLKVPFFKKAITPEGEVVEVTETTEESVEEETTEKVEEVKVVKKGKRWGLILAAVLVSLIPAYYFPTFISKYNPASGATYTTLANFTTIAETIMWVAMILVLGLWITAVAVKVFKGEEASEKARAYAWKVTKPTLLVAFIALVLRYFTVNAGSILVDGYYWNAPTTNQIGYWALVSAIITVLALVITHYTVNKAEGATVKTYGLRGTVKQVLVALLLALTVVVGLYVVVFLIDLIFNTDFRLWVYAVKSFNLHHVVALLKYAPIFFIYYLINSVSVVANTKDIKGWKGHLYAMFLNAGGLVLFLIYHYGKLFLTGTAAYPTLALQPILLFGLIPSLALAAVFTRKIHEKTNNVWVAVFLNTILFTLITVANTAIYLLSM